LGTLPFYFLGYWGHRERIYQFVQKYGKWLWISADGVDQAFVYFKKFGGAFVLLGRCIPLVRTFVSFPAGAVRMNFVRFSTLTLIGSMLWTALLAGVGYRLGAQWSQAAEFIKSYEHWVLGVIAILGATWVVWRILLFVQHKRKKTLEKSE
jgi:membrane protein DedA with SNARE-associated domain